MDGHGPSWAGIASVVALASAAVTGAPSCALSPHDDDDGPPGDELPGDDDDGADDDDTAPGPFVVTARALESGSVDPAGEQTVDDGAMVVFQLAPRVDGCTIVPGGTCGGDLYEHEGAHELVTWPIHADCSVEVTFDCGPSSLLLRPEQVGVFWEQTTQPFEVTQRFDDGREADVTAVMAWSSDDPSTVTVDSSGLATVLRPHGVVEITATDPQSSVLAPVTTSLTVMHVTDWQSPDVLEYTTGTVYLSDVRFEPGWMHWDWSPRPWEPFDNTVSGRIWALWSEDGGATYSALSWDWIGNTTESKSIGEMPAAWMGTMLTTVCDEYPDTCNGRDRSNVWFEGFP